VSLKEFGQKIILLRLLCHGMPSVCLGTETEVYSKPHCRSPGMLNTLWIVCCMIVYTDSIWQVVKVQLPSKVYNVNGKKAPLLFSS